ncbi:uncharacterized protein P884DRAFT_273498 [Thermothelomyces heterothallicus CBS 202.75]|uniref:uncharacterized protein n=1 Tax=Thermothelomyces heterothallicus CBS 202.75 TaxID=1149848 RepID=UPI0037425603
MDTPAADALVPAQDALCVAVTAVTAARAAHALAASRLSSLRAQLARHEQSAAASAAARRAAALGRGRGRGRCGARGCGCGGGGGSEGSGDWRAAAAAASGERERWEALGGLVRDAAAEARARAAELRVAERTLARAWALLRAVVAGPSLWVDMAGDVGGGTEVEEGMGMMTAVDGGEGPAAGTDTGAGAGAGAARTSQGQQGGEESEEGRPAGLRQRCRQQQQRQRRPGGLLGGTGGGGGGDRAREQVAVGDAPRPVPDRGDDDGLLGWRDGRTVLDGDQYRARQGIRDDFARLVRERAEQSTSVEEARAKGEVAPADNATRLWWEAEDGDEDWTDDEIFIPAILPRRTAIAKGREEGTQRRAVIIDRP